MTSRWAGVLIGALVGLLVWHAVPDGAAYAQSSDEPASEDGTYTLVLRDVPLRKALDELVSMTHINLIYDSDLMSEQRVFCSGEDVVPEALLQCILNDVPIDYVRTSSGTYVLVESAREAARYGRFAGRVVDEETGEPLPHAHVLLADASTGTATNEAGLFSFSSLLSGPHRVVVTHMGYRTHVDHVWVPPDEDVRERIALRPEPVSGDAVVVTGLQQRLPSQELGRSEFAAGQTEMLSGMGTPDVARGAGTLMGVARQSPMAELHIQGGSTGEHQVQLDGIPVRNPVSLGQLLGAFSPLAIGRYTVHKAGFGASRGSHIAGLVSVEHDVTRPGDRIATLKADPVSINGRVQRPITLPGGIEGDAMVTARQSMWGVYRDPALKELFTEWNTVDPLLAAQVAGWEDDDIVPELEEDDDDVVLEPYRNQIGVSFSDLHAATRLELDPFRTLYASIYRGTNEIGADVRSATDLGTDDSTRSVTTRDAYDWSNLGGQARLEWLMGARTIGTLRLHGSRHTSHYDYLPQGTTDQASGASSSASSYPSSSEVPDEDNAVNEIGVEGELSYSVASQHRVQAALEAVRTDSEFRAGNRFIQPITYENATWHLAGHVQGEHSLGLQTTLEWGTRLTFIPDRRTAYAEPRLALRYDRSQSALGGFAARVATGLYRQYVNRFDLSSTGPTSVVPSIRFWLPVDRSVAPPRAYHLAADALVMPTSNWTISAEVYYKHQPRILAVDYAALRDGEAAWSAAQDDFVAASRGMAYGGGLRLKYEGERLQSTLSYTLSRSRRTFPSRFDGRMEPVPWNEPHRLALDADVPVLGPLTAHLSWKGIWGRTWAFRRAYYDYLAVGAASDAFEPYRLSRPSDHTLPPTYQLDAGLSYTQTWGDVRVEARAQLVNVLDRANTFDWSLRPNGSGFDRSIRALPGRRPVVTLTVGY